MRSFLLWMFVFFFFGGLIAMVGKNMYDILKGLYDFFLRDLVNRNLYFVIPDPRVKSFLERYSRFYLNLGTKDKLLFQRRVQKFIEVKSFKPGSGVHEVTLEMQTVFSSYAVQVTFGLPSVYLSYFDTIVVHKEDYLSPKIQCLCRGELDDDGIIIASWKSVCDDNVLRNARRNVLLNLLGQALAISNNCRGEDNACLDNKWFLKFLVQGRYEMDCIAQGSLSFFSDAHPQTDYEFFGAAVEYFFLCPVELYQAQPNVYYLLTEVLKQDPLSTERRSITSNKKILPAHQ